MVPEVSRLAREHGILFGRRSTRGGARTGRRSTRARSTLVVENAMSRSRKLTHDTAQLLVLALLASEPARVWFHRQPSFEEPVVREALELLSEFEILQSENQQYPAALIPSAAASALAKRLASSVAKISGVGLARHYRIARTIEAQLLNDGPGMVASLEDMFTKSRPQQAKAVAILGSSEFGYEVSASRIEQHPIIQMLHVLRPDLASRALEAGRKGKIPKPRSSKKKVFP
jgi:hypothetical protein